MNDIPEPAWLFEKGDAEEAFAVQVLRYLDGLATPQDLSELKEGLSRHLSYRTTFVRLCRLHGELTELLAPERARVERDQHILCQLVPSCAAVGKTPAGTVSEGSGSDAEEQRVATIPGTGDVPPSRESHSEPGPTTHPLPRNTEEITEFLTRNPEEDTQH